MNQLEHLTIPRPTQEGGSIFINGFPSGPKPYEEVLTFLRKGTLLQKYGRHGTPKYHHFRLSSDDSELQWESKGGRIRRVPIQWIKRWQKGQETAIFKKHPQPNRVGVSFSIIYLDETKKERSLDVICNSANDFELWFWGVQIVKHYPPHAWTAYVQQQVDQLRKQTTAVSWDAKLQPEPTPKGLGQELRAKSNTPKAPERRELIALHRQANAALQPAYNTHGKRELGDLYIWGSLAAREDDDTHARAMMAVRGSNGAMYSNSINPDPLANWQQTPTPVLVQNTSSVDVVKAACGTRNAALITRAGELYTWGAGKEGNLGLGTQMSVASPRQVSRMRGKGIKSVSCSEGCTAAISSDGRLYTWGHGNAGQHGHGHTFMLAEPKLLTCFMDEVHIEQVSCGPYHTAAVSYDGTLYTWGNGLFGKLGHGDHTSVYTPRAVEALDEHFVFNASAGYWHTAAVAIPRGRAIAREHEQARNRDQPAFERSVSSSDNGFGGGRKPPPLPLPLVETGAVGVKSAGTPAQQPLLTRSASSVGPDESVTRAATAPPVAGSKHPLMAAAAMAVAAVAGSLNSLASSVDSITSSSTTVGWDPAAAAAASTSTAGVPPAALRASSSSPHRAQQQPAEAAISIMDSPPQLRQSGGSPDIGSRSSASKQALLVARRLSHAGSDLSSPVAATAVAAVPPPRPATSPPQLQHSGRLLQARGVDVSTSSSSDIPTGADLGLSVNGLSVTSLHSPTSVVEVDGSDDSSAGGALFTWGGEFEWTEPCDVRRSKDASSVKKDTHKGCLGTGDREGRMLPTRIGGELDTREVVQVACGWNLTVAVTRDGRVFQMGGTGAYNPEEKSVAWEGCNRPTQVDGNLFGHFIEEVACGMHHVVVVASKVQANGKLHDDLRRVRLMSWGKGSHGQLGTELPRDCNLPQIVPAVDGRRILNIAAGGHHTLAVCEHDPRETRRSYPPSAAGMSGSSGMASPLASGASYMPSTRPPIPTAASFLAASAAVFDSNVPSRMTGKVQAALKRYASTKLVAMPKMAAFSMRTDSSVSSDSDLHRAHKQSATSSGYSMAQAQQLHHQQQQLARTQQLQSARQQTFSSAGNNIVRSARESRGGSAGRVDAMQASAGSSSAERSDRYSPTPVNGLLKDDASTVSPTSSFSGLDGGDYVQQGTWGKPASAPLSRNASMDRGSSGGGSATSRLELLARAKPGILSIGTGAELFGNGPMPNASAPQLGAFSLLSEGGGILEECEEEMYDESSVVHDEEEQEEDDEQEEDEGQEDDEGEADEVDEVDSEGVDDLNGSIDLRTRSSHRLPPNQQVQLVPGHRRTLSNGHHQQHVPHPLHVSTPPLPSSGASFASAPSAHQRSMPPAAAAHLSLKVDATARPDESFDATASSSASPGSGGGSTPLSSAYAHTPSSPPTHFPGSIHDHFEHGHHAQLASGDHLAQHSHHPHLDITYGDGESGSQRNSFTSCTSNRSDPERTSRSPRHQQLIQQHLLSPHHHERADNMQQGLSVHEAAAIAATAAAFGTCASGSGGTPRRAREVSMVGWMSTVPSLLRPSGGSTSCGGAGGSGGITIAGGSGGAPGHKRGASMHLLPSFVFATGSPSSTAAAASAAGGQPNPFVTSPASRAVSHLQPHQVLGAGFQVSEATLQPAASMQSQSSAGGALGALGAKLNSHPLTGLLAKADSLTHDGRAAGNDAPAPLSPSPRTEQQLHALLPWSAVAGTTAASNLITPITTTTIAAALSAPAVGAAVTVGLGLPPRGMSSSMGGGRISANGSGSSEASKRASSAGGSGPVLGTIIDATAIPAAPLQMSAEEDKPAPNIAQVTAENQALKEKLEQLERQVALLLKVSNNPAPTAVQLMGSVSGGGMAVEEHPQNLHLVQQQQQQLQQPPVLQHQGSGMRSPGSAAMLATRSRTGNGYATYPGPGGRDGYSPSNGLPLTAGNGLGSRRPSMAAAAAAFADASIAAVTAASPAVGGAQVDPRPASRGDIPLHVKPGSGQGHTLGLPSQPLQPFIPSPLANGGHGSGHHATQPLSARERGEPFPRTPPPSNSPGPSRPRHRRAVSVDVFGARTPLAAFSPYLTPSGTSPLQQMHSPPNNLQVGQQQLRGSSSPLTKVPLFTVTAAPAPADPSTDAHRPVEYLEEMYPGVTLHLLPPGSTPDVDGDSTSDGGSPLLHGAGLRDGSGLPELVKVVYSRKRFTNTEAKSWWQAHKAEICQAYDMRHMRHLLHDTSPSLMSHAPIPGYGGGVSYEMHSTSSGGGAEQGGHSSQGGSAYGDVALEEGGGATAGAGGGNGTSSRPRRSRHPPVGIHSFGSSSSTSGGGSGQPLSSTPPTSAQQNARYSHVLPHPPRRGGGGDAAPAPADATAYGDAGNGYGVISNWAEQVYEVVSSPPSMPLGQLAAMPRSQRAAHARSASGGGRPRGALGGSGAGGGQ